jgi:DNA polymerase
MAIHLDFETASACDIGLGSYRYASDSSTRILMFAVARGEGEPQLWSFDDPFSDESLAAESILRKAIEDRELIYAHNAQFEIAICDYRLKADVGLDAPDISQWRCTLAMCRRAAAPESLASAAEFFGLGDQKNPIGKALIDIFSDLTKPVVLVPPEGMKDPDTVKPLKNGRFTVGKKPKNRKSASPIFDEATVWGWQVKAAGGMLSVGDAWRKFCKYCKQDVRVEQELHRRLAHFELAGDVLASFQFDLRMNRRGVPVNVQALDNADRLVNHFKEKLGSRFTKMCGLEPNQRDRKLQWLRERGYPAEDMQAGTVEKILEKPPESMTPMAVEVLRMHSLMSFSALAKIPKMRDAACADQRVRGTMQWHAARTGRAGGRIIQPQNFKKATINDSELCYRMIRENWEPFWFEDFWESPLEAIASSIRHFIHPHKGEFFDVDYAGVEARITPWLAGDVKKLELILSGVDLYKRMASMLFGVPYEAITKPQRTDAKPVELGCCIAEDELVLTKRGLVPIQAIELDDLVWDGVEWVSHEGVIYQGEREVVTYQGLTATEDHEVWVDGGTGKIHLGDAVAQGRVLLITGDGGTPVRGLDIGESWLCPGGESPESAGPMLVREVLPEFPRRDAEGCQPALRGVPVRAPQTEAAPMACRRISHGEDTLREPGPSTIQGLRGERDRVQIYVSPRSGGVDDGALRAAPRQGNRPHRQQRPLRAGELALVHEVRTEQEYPEDKAPEGLCLQAGGMALLQGHRGAASSGGVVSGADSGSREESGRRETAKLGGNRKTVRVYDLLNAGPRHRFTVSGKLVSNCFGVGGKGLRDAMAKPPYNLDRTLAQCREYVKVYRENHPETVQAWRDIEDAAKSAISQPGKAFFACGKKLAFAFGRVAGIPYLTMRLPSGRRLYYPHAKVKQTFKKYDEEEMDEQPWKRAEGGYWVDQISFYGKMRDSAHWGRVGTWGSRLFENAVQAIGADLLNRGLIEADRRGFEIPMIVHDQALGETHSAPGTLEEFTRALCTKDDWSATFPLEASGAIHPYYLKDD